MAPSFDSVEDRRAIFDRRAVADVLATGNSNDAVAVLKQALADGRAEIARRIAAA